MRRKGNVGKYTYYKKIKCVVLMAEKAEDY
jgi:hypothetical protein